MPRTISQLGPEYCTLQLFGNFCNKALLLKLQFSSSSRYWNRARGVHFQRRTKEVANSHSQFVPVIPGYAPPIRGPL